MLIIYKANIYIYAPPTAKAELKKFFWLYQEILYFCTAFQKALRDGNLCVHSQTYQGSRV